MNTELDSHQHQSHKPSLVLDKHIGSGKFSVYHGTAPSSQEEYAVKIFPYDKISQTLFNREKENIETLFHPNVIRYISHSNLGIQNQKYKALILEYAPYGDFYTLLATGKLGGERLLLQYFNQLVEGVEYLHSEEIAHCDLKLENLLLGKDYLLKITDFDHAQRPGDMKNISRGTMGYRAPEVIEGTCKDNFAADVYSVGILLYVFITRELPFLEAKQGDGENLGDFEIFCQDKDAFWDKKAIESQNHILFDDDFRELLNGMLEKDPETRLTLKKVKASKWYKSWVFIEKGLRTKPQKVSERGFRGFVQRKDLNN